MKRRAIMVWLGWLGLIAWLVIGVLSHMHKAGLPPDRLYRDFYEFYSGAHAMLTGGDVYAAGKLGYIYPPLFGFLLMPIAALPLSVAAHLWLVIKIALLLACAALGVNEVLRRLGRTVLPTQAAWIALIGTLFIVDKVRTEMNMQQCNLLVLLSFVLGLRWIDRRPVLAGIAIGFGANIKYLTLICVPYLLVRRRYKAACVSVLSTIAWAFVPALALGWRRNLQLLAGAVDGLGNLAGQNAVGADAARVMHPDFGLSIPSFAVRYLGNGGHSAITILFTLTLALVVFLLAWWCYRGAGIALFRKREFPVVAGSRVDRAMLVEWCGLIMAALLFGPQTNSPHLSLLLFPCIAAAAILLGPPPGVSRVPLWVCLTIMIASQVLPPGGWAPNEVVDFWRSLSGPIWAIIPFCLALIWTGLRLKDPQMAELESIQPPPRLGGS